jgi:hypothetical protein
LIQHQIQQSRSQREFRMENKLSDSTKETKVDTYTIWSKCFNCHRKTELHFPVGTRAQQYIQENKLEPKCFHCKCKLVTS